MDRVGLPECALNLAQAAAYLALAPKSNASTHGDLEGDAPTCASTAPPSRLPTSRTPTTPERKKLGRGEGYRYPHDEPDAVTDQPLAPESVRDERFYEPTDRGFEAELRKRLEWLRERLGQRPRISARLSAVTARVELRNLGAEGRVLGVV